MSRRLFLTGAGSFIGTELARQARAAGDEVVGIDSRPGGDWATADIRDPELADLIPDSVDAIIHLAALSRDPDCRDRARLCFDVNVMGTLSLIEAAQARRARQFIFASSEWVYDSFVPGEERTEDDPIDAAGLVSEYALSKYVSEINLLQKARHGFCPTAILRFGIVYGSRSGNWSAVEALFNAVATQDEITVGALATGRRFLHISDVASGIRAALGLAGTEIVNIQGPRMVTLGEVIETSARLLGRSIRVVESAPATPSLRPVSSAKAERLLGWRADMEIEAGLRDLARFLGCPLA